MSDTVLATMDVDLVWDAIQALLQGDIGNDVDVDCIGEEDFDEEGMLTIRTPAARVLFMDELPKPVESQNLSYWSEQRFAVLCADEDHSQDPQVQRSKSLCLAKRVMTSLVGARLVLGNGITSDPILYTGMRPMATAAAGMAYVPSFLIPGVLQFPGTHAVPSQPQEGENNGQR